jgi:hypothetical protein
MERSGIRENPGFRPDGLHPGYVFFIQPLSRVNGHSLTLNPSVKVLQRSFPKLDDILKRCLWRLL